jgi:hypothetical protein
MAAWHAACYARTQAQEQKSNQHVQVKRFATEEQPQLEELRLYERNRFVLLQLGNRCGKTATLQACNSVATAHHCVCAATDVASKQHTTTNDDTQKLHKHELSQRGIAEPLPLKAATAEVPGYLSRRGIVFTYPTTPTHILDASVVSWYPYTQAGCFVVSTWPQIVAERQPRLVAFLFQRDAASS